MCFSLCSVDDENKIIVFDSKTSFYKISGILSRVQSVYYNPHLTWVVLSVAEL